MRKIQAVSHIGVQPQNLHIQHPFPFQLLFSYGWEREKLLHPPSVESIFCLRFSHLHHFFLDFITRGSEERRDEASWEVME